MPSTTLQTRQASWPILILIIIRSGPRRYFFCTWNIFSSYSNTSYDCCNLSPWSYCWTCCHKYDWTCCHKSDWSCCLRYELMSHIQLLLLPRVLWLCLNLMRILQWLVQGETAKVFLCILFSSVTFLGWKERGQMPMKTHWCWKSGKLELPTRLFLIR